MSTFEPIVFPDIAQIIAPSDLYTVLSAVQSEMNIGWDTMVDSVEITFMVNGRTGVFTTERPLDLASATEGLIDLTDEATIINALYALA